MPKKESRICQYVDEYGFHCTKRLVTGRKYCHLHRQLAQEGAYRENRMIDKATKRYIDYHMKRTYVYVSMFFIVLMFPFTYVGTILNQCWTVGFIGIVLSFILSLYISIKYLKVKLNPRKDVQEKTPEYVDWVQTRVNKVKKEREFRKNLWK
jgi:hypothetical protein